MKATTTTPPWLLLLPLELRKQIYDYILSDLEGISGADHRRHWPSAPRDYLAMLLTNRQIHDEIVETLYSRTWTISITCQGLIFLGIRHKAKWKSQKLRRNIDEDPSNLDKPFPTSFPFHHIKHLRVRFRHTLYPRNKASKMMTTAKNNLIWRRLLGFKDELIWRRLLGYLRLLGTLLNQITENQPSFRKFGFIFVKTRKRYKEDEPVHLDSSAMLQILEPLRDNVRNFESCELCLMDCTDEDPNVLRIARECGSAIISKRGVDNPSDICLKKDDSNDNLTLAANRSSGPVIHRNRRRGMITLQFTRSQLEASVLESGPS